MDDMVTTRSTEIENRIGQLETNSVSGRVAKLDAEQHVTVQRQRLTRNPSTWVQAQSPRLIVTKAWEMLGKLDVPSCGAWNDWEPIIIAAHRPAGQEVDERHEKLSGVGNTCHERGLEHWPGEGQQLYAALLAHAEPYREDARPRWQRRRKR